MECAVQAICGGCPLLSLARTDELTTKVESVAAKLAAVGIKIGVKLYEAPAGVDGWTIKSRFGYRNRLRMQVVDGQADFFNDAKSQGCPVVRDDLWTAIEHLRSVSALRPELMAGSRHLEVRVADDGSPGVVLSDPVDTALLGRALGSDWAVAYRGAQDPLSLSYDVAHDVLVEVPITSFVQVNSAVNRQLVKTVLAVAGEVGAKSFLDLFCGSGNFAIPLAAQGLSGIAVDNAGDAISQLGQSAAARNGSVSCIEGDARAVLGDLSAADLVIADPPRAGLQENYGQIVELVGDTLVLIGCKASAFAADVAALCERGLLLESVTVFDMFPGTKHVEALAVFRRVRPDPES